MLAEAYPISPLTNLCTNAVGRDGVRRQHAGPGGLPQDVYLLEFGAARCPKGSDDTTANVREGSVHQDDEVLDRLRVRGRRRGDGGAYVRHGRP